jgi:hypothetical protein
MTRGTVTRALYKSSKWPAPLTASARHGCYSQHGWAEIPKYGRVLSRCSAPSIQSNVPPQAAGGEADEETWPGFNRRYARFWNDGTDRDRPNATARRGEFERPGPQLHPHGEAGRLQRHARSLLRPGLGAPLLARPLWRGALPLRPLLLSSARQSRMTRGRLRAASLSLVDAPPASVHASVREWLRRRRTNAAGAGFLNAASRGQEAQA